jgi:tetratricopeptide (TPR) repeat protein
MRNLTFIIGFMLLLAMGVYAQDETATSTPTVQATPTVFLPNNYRLNGITYHAQTWNNCGPATVTMALSYFGYTADQQRAANWLKPNREDKNVSPWQMVEYINTQVPELHVYALERFGGDLQRLKTLVYSGFPVIIEVGYDPDRAAQGWMGHYLLVIGWDDQAQTLITMDSYDGANLAYSYDHIETHWQHFNYNYIVLYESGGEALLLQLLGDDADPQQNAINAFYKAREQAVNSVNTDQEAFAWFNMGSMLTQLERYQDASTAFDKAREIGLPWRMMWYQFTPYEAYLEMERYDDVISLATEIISNSGGNVEESYYYAGLARYGMGEYNRARDNLNMVVNFNQNFSPAQTLLDQIGRNPSN